MLIIIKKKTKKIRSTEGDGWRDRIINIMNRSFQSESKEIMDLLRICISALKEIIKISNFNNKNNEY